MKKLTRLFLLVAGAVLAAVVVRWIKNMKPLTTDGLDSHPNPARSYEDAVARVEAMQALDTAEINPVCRTKLYTHGHKTENVLVYFHGFTNCPQQFHQLAQTFFEKGYNVFTPRMPLHGMSNRAPKEFSQLTAEALAQFTDEVVDIAHGLGEKVTLFGLSLGGTMTGWAAQNRADVDLAVLVAPLLAVKTIPRPIEKPLATAMLNLPSVFIWWDPRVRLNMPPYHAYPGYSTHAMAQCMRLAYRLKEDAALYKPYAKSILVVSNAADLAVSNDVIDQMVANWRKNGAENVRDFCFDGDLGIIHDMIDPDQRDQQIDTVYPVLVNLVTENANGTQAIA